MFRVSCIQLISTNNIHQNLKRTEKLIDTYNTYDIFVLDVDNIY